MKRINILFLSLSLITINAIADETMEEKAKELGKDTKRNLNSTDRTIKDKTCEMVKGKMECTVQKVKHSVQEGADKVEDAVD